MRSRAVARVAIFAALAVACLLVARAVPVGTAVDGLRLWAQNQGPLGMVGLGSAYVILALLFVPGAVLTMMVGAVLGLGWGLVVVAIATSVADAAAFLIGRYVARRAVLGLMDRYPVLRVVDRAITLGQWRIVALIRLNPTIPYSAGNYLFGASGISFLHFILSSGIFTLPGAFAYLYLGYMGAETLSGADRTTVEWTVLALGLGATLAAIAYLPVLARRALAELADAP